MKTIQQARQYETQKMREIPEGQRPVFHLSPPTGWMNDPNGFSVLKGEIHLFFQYNPYHTEWDAMHWGHAKTGDFISWEYLPAALAPDQWYDEAGVFSGSALTYKGRHILMYTGVSEAKDERGEKVIRQRQCIAVGDGLDYQKSERNPVICAEQLPEGSSREDFRDPKIWEEDGRFFAVVGNRSADGSGQIALFSSEDLGQWSFCAILDRCRNEYGKMWECPDFFPLDGKQILMVSPQDMTASGLEFHCGNGSMFLVGGYEKEKFRFEREWVQAADYGLDFYAPQTVQTTDGRRVMIAWMKSWDTRLSPEDFQWSSMMTVPRELTVRNGRVCQNPVRELERHRTERVVYEKIEIQEERRLEGVCGRVLDLTVRIADGDFGKFRLRLAAKKERYSEMIYDREEEILTFDRTHAGGRRDVAVSRSMYAGMRGGELKLRILMDRYSVEIFVNDGEQAMTSLIYTEQEAEGITFQAKRPATVSVEKYRII